MKILNWVRQLITKKPIIHYIYTDTIIDSRGAIKRKYTVPTGKFSSKTRKVLENVISKLENMEHFSENEEIIISKNEKVVISNDYFTIYGDLDWKLLKDSRVMKFTIPTGKISAEEAKKLLTEQMNRYKEDINFEEATGEIAINGIKKLPFYKTIWI